MASDYLKNGNWCKKDEMYTPIILVKPILGYLKPNSIVWCPFDNETSEYTILLREAGHEVIATHIANDEDFFNLDIECDYIISNPPFSLKKEVFKRLFSLNKAFAMLMNITALQYQDVSNMFYEYQTLGYETQLLLFDKKVSFNGNTSSFGVGYICYGLLPKQLIYYHLDHNNTNNNYIKSRMILEE